VYLLGRMVLVNLRKKPAVPDAVAATGVQVQIEVWVWLDAANCLSIAGHAGQPNITSNSLPSGSAIVTHCSWLASTRAPSRVSRSTSAPTSAHVRSR
jgi:hypothetical protein